MSSNDCSRNLDALEQALQVPMGTDAPVAWERLRELVRCARRQCTFEVGAIERLRESEARWRSIATNPFDFVTVVDADAVFQYVNRTVPQTRAEDLIGRASIYDWTAPEYHATIRDALAQVFRTGKPAYYEAFSPQVPAWFSSVIGPIVQDDKVVAASVQARDITPRKQAELALRDSEERFRQLAESIEDVFFLIEPVAARVLYVSPAYEKLWGRRLADVYGSIDAWLHGVHPDDRASAQARFDAVIAACREGETGFAFGRPLEMRIVHADGSVRHVRTRLFPVRDDWGRVRRVAGVVSDLTERVEAEMKLAAAEQRFRTLVEELPVISYIASTEDTGRVLYISPQIESKLGFPARAWQEDGFWLSRIHPDDRERVLGALIEFGSTEKLLPGRYRFLASDGSSVWFHDEAVVVRSPGAAPVIQGVLLDVTEAEVARAEQQQSRAGASYLVEVQESERRRIARELHDEVGQALTSLNFLLESMREAAGASVVDEARQLVGELLDRVRNLSLDLRPSMLDDLGLLPALLYMFERYTKQTHVRVRFEHRGMDGRFGAELETAAFRLVQETLTNVARHARVQEVDVRASCDGKVLSLQIEDAGVGFDVAGPAAARVSSGLVGMRERVALLGGEFFLDSSPGRGTHLGVRLPLARAEP